MRINVNFTVNVDPANLAALREFMECEDNVDAAAAVRSEAEDYVVEYFTDHGIPLVVVARNGVPVEGA